MAAASAVLTAFLSYATLLAMGVCAWPPGAHLRLSPACPLFAAAFTARSLTRLQL